MEDKIYTKSDLQMAMEDGCKFKDLQDLLDFIERREGLKNEDSNCNIGGVICCGVLEKMNLGWMETKDGRKCMPYITKHDATMYRVNYCPSCGKYVRDVIV